MEDIFTKVTTRSWGSRLMGSLMGILVGPLIFLASFGILYWNEGRVNLAALAETATALDAQGAPSPDLDGTFVSVTGEATAAEVLGDEFVRPGPFLFLSRSAEMYAWVEHTRNSSERNVGGSETTTTTYSYEQEWTGHPESSAQFEHPEGHENPAFTALGKQQRVQTLMLGQYTVYTSTLTTHNMPQLALTKDMVLESDGFVFNGAYLYKGTGTLSSPRVGDVRVSYTGLQSPASPVTVFGTLDLAAKRIDPLRDGKTTLHYLFADTRDGALAQLQTQESIFRWLLRGIGFIMMWFGLMMFFGPISTFLDLLPVAGSISRGAVGFVAFVASVVLSAVTILVSMVFHNAIALTVVLLVTMTVLVVWYKKRNTGQPAAL